MTKIKRLNGDTLSFQSKEKAIEEMFRRQWVNGDVGKYMQSVKRRVFEMYHVELLFSNETEFFNELKKNGLIEIINK